MTNTPFTVTNEQKVNATGGANFSQIVTLSNGTILVAYSTRQGDAPGPGNGFAILGQLFSPEGEPIGGEFTFPTGDDHGDIDEKAFSLDAMPGSNRVVLSTHQTGAPSDVAIHTSVFDFDNSAGNFQAAEPERLDFGTAIINQDASFLSPSVQAFAGSVVGVDGDSYNQFFVTRSDGKEKLKALDASDSDVGSVENLKNFDGTANAETQADQLADGRFVVILDRDGEDRGDGDIHYEVLQADGVTQVNDGETGVREHATYDSTVTALSGVGFVIAWTMKDDFDIDVQFQVFNNNGQPITEVKTALGGLHSDNNNNEPVIVALNDGGFVIFADVDIGEIGIFGQRYDKDGDKVGQSFKVTGDNATNLDATLLDDGRIAISWNVFKTGRVEMEILSVEATQGDDDLKGSGGDNTIRGLGGDDTIDGRNGNDLLDGGDGNDVLDGGKGEDTLQGGAGDDILNGGEDDDRLFGGSGSDIFAFDEGHGKDRIFGFNATNDNEKIDLSKISAITDFIDLLQDHIGTDGNDVVIDTRGGNFIRLVDTNLLELGESDFIFSHDNINGANGADTLIGTDADEVLRGEGGDDRLEGAGGNDILYGGAGDDIFVFSDGDGQDEIRGFNATRDGEKIDLKGISGVTGFEDLIPRMEQVGDDVRIDLGDGNEVLLRNVDLDDLDAADFIFANPGLTIIGTEGDDTLIGTDGDDIIRGLTGNDVISGGGGDDLIDGGGSADTIDAGAGNDTVIGRGGIDQVDLGDGDDIFEDDPQNNNNGKDTVLGGAGNDTFLGAGGADIFNGGTGNDIAHAGLGNETFIFASGDGTDLIIGFGTEGDVIDLSAVVDITDFADLSAGHIVQVGDDVRIDGAGLVITLQDTNLADLSAENFLF